MVAAVATEEPEVAANSAQQPILVCKRPPGRRPSHTANTVYMRSAMPERNRNSPSSTNSGIAVSPFSLIVPQATEAAEFRNAMPNAIMPPARPTSSITAPIGRPTSIRPTMTMKPMMPTEIMLIAHRLSAMHRR